MRRYIPSICIHFGMLWCAWAWDLHGLAGAGRMLTTALTLYGLAGLWALCATPGRHERPPALSELRFLKQLLVLVLGIHLVWHGHPVLAGLLALGVLGAAAYRRKQRALRVADELALFGRER